MTQYRVATYHTVEADNPVEAAQKAFILHDEMTPEEYVVEDVSTDSLGSFTVLMTDANKDEARELQRQGKLFRAETFKD
ncbi:hypothetical protein U8P73_36290 (plasmid) [Rhizobium beringeri]|uniref:hypothetical protein n=1 Tax=Rhizobium beringeri TaxID=3019934 RepID=UPI002DDCA0CE|nr:hypothetical protein [Rhizobium beringeri]WSG93611.1 hypothetical protein U8P73_36290 [Rhizobium beringeri]